MGPHLRKVTYGADIQLTVFSRPHIEQMQRPKLFVDDSIGAGTSRLNIKFTVLHKLLDPLRSHVVREEGHRTIAVRKEVNRIADPHWVEVAGVIPGNCCL